MKLTFFLIALALILLRLCCPTLEIWHNIHGHGSMIMRNGDYIQEVKWSGKIRLSDDERSVAEISPGGYLEYRENDTSLKAESNLQGEIRYSLYDGHERLPLNDSGRQFIAGQIQKMIRFGFFAEGRAEKIYKKGGVRALLAELSRIKMEGSRDQYFDLLFKSDSLNRDEEIALLRLIDSSTDMMQQEGCLKRFTNVQLRDSAVARQWLGSVGHLGESYFKKELLLNYIGADTGAGLDPDRYDSVLAITTRFESDADQEEVYRQLAGLPPVRMYDPVYAQPWLRAVGQLREAYMKKDLLLRYLGRDRPAGTPVPGDQFDSVIAIAGHFQSSTDEQEVYKRMADLSGITDEEWASLIRATGTLNEDYMKTELLLKIAPKMPRTDSLRTVYRTAAKSIREDMDYGKVIRAME
ncbi:MAG TPA: hypothetical protein VG101_00870 [Puia sp.]|jgi:hypothetical protein|nr:hypothetical protein [Puia sp.]